MRLNLRVLVVWMIVLAALMAPKAVSAIGPDNQSQPVTLAANRAVCRGTTIVLSYDVELDKNSVPDPGDYRVLFDGSPVAVRSVAVDGNTVTLTLAQGASSGAIGITLDYTPGTRPVQDTVGSLAAGLTAYSVTNASTSLASPRASINGNTVALTYGVELGTASIPAAGDFTVSFTRLPDPVPVTAVTVSGSAVVLTLEQGAVSSDVVTVGYTPGVKPLMSADGVPAPALDASTAADNQTKAVTLKAASIEGTTLVLTYDAPLFEKNVPATGDFAVKYGATDAAVAGVRVAGNTVTLALGSAPHSSDVVTVTYTPGAIPLVSLPGSPVPAVPAKPVIVTSQIDYSSASVNGDSLFLVFDTILDAKSVPVATDFKVKFGLTSVPVTGVTMAGSTVTLALAQGAAEGDAVTLEYQPTKYPLRNLQGTLADDLLPSPVTNNSKTPVFDTAVVNGTTLRLFYLAMLRRTSVPDPGDFTVSTGAVTGVSIDGNTLTLTLATGAKEGQTVTVSYTPGVHPVSGTAGSPAAALTNKPVSNSSKAPKVASASVNGTAMTIAYDAVLSGQSVPDPGNFTVNIGSQTANVTTVTITGNIVKLVLDKGAASSDTVTVTYSAGARPLMGDSGTPVDNLIPSVTNRSTALTLNTADINGSAVVLAFDAPLMTGAIPASSDFAVSYDGTPKTVSRVAISGNQVILTMAEPVPATAVVSLTYTPGAVPLTSAAGAPVTTPITKSVTNGAGALTLRSRTVVGNTVTFEFSAALDPTSLPLPGDFAVSDGSKSYTVSAVEISGRLVILRLAAGVRGGDTISVDYTPGPAPLRTASGIQPPAITGAVVNNTPPFSLVSAFVNGASLSVEYSGGFSTTLVPAPGDYTVTVNAAPVQISRVTLQGRTVLLTLAQGVRAADTVTLNYTAAAGRSLTSSVGTLAPSFSGTSVTNNSQAFALSTATVSGNLITITYSAPPSPSSVPATGDYQVKFNANSVAVTAVAIAGNTVTLKLASAPLSADTVTVGYTPGSRLLMNAFGSPAAAVTAQPVTTAMTYPSVISASVNGRTLELLYDTPLNASLVPALTEYTVEVGGVAGPAVSRVNVLGNKVTLTLAAGVRSADGVTLTYTAAGGKLQGLTGSPAPAFSKRAVINTTSGVALNSATINGNTLVLAYDAALDPKSVPAVTDYTVQVNGTGRVVSRVVVNGQIATLVLSAGVIPADSVTIAYTPGTNPVADLAGSPAGALSGQPVTNNSAGIALVTAEVTGKTLTLTYDGALNTASTPAAADFTVTFQQSGPGVAVSVTSVTVSGNTVALTLVRGADSQTKVTVGYRPGTKPLTSVSGSPAAMLVAANVTNYSPAMSPVTATITGATLVLTYDTPLSTRPLPANTDFTVKFNGVAQPVTGVSISGSAVTLKLAQGARGSDVVTLDYPVGTNPVMTTSGAPSAPIAAYAVTNSSPDVSLSTASVSGKTLTLMYNTALNTSFMPGADDFTVTVAGKAITIARLVVSGQTVTLTLGAGVAPGDQVTLDYTPGTNPLKSTVGTPAPALSDTVVRNDSSPIAVPTATINGTTLSLLFAVPLTTASVPSPSDFAVRIDTKSVTVNRVAIQGNQVLLTLATGAASGSTVDADYQLGLKPLSDLAGTPAPAFTGLVAVNNSVTFKAPTATITGNTLSLVYDVALATSPVPSANGYTVTVAGTPAVVVPVTKVTATRSTVTLTLARGVSDGDSVTLDYDPAAASVLLLSLSGSPAPALTGVSVDNATEPVATISKTVNGNTIALTFDQVLDPLSVPDPVDFVAIVSGKTAEIARVTISGSMLKLTLAKGVSDNDLVTLQYGAGAKPLNSKAGSPVGVISGLVNNVTAAMDVKSATVNGSTLLIAFPTPLSPASVPLAADFNVLIGSETVDVSGVSVSGAMVKLTLVQGAASNDTVSVAYTPGNKVLLSSAGSPIPSFSKSVSNISISPTLVSTVVQGATLSLTYDQVLSISSRPLPSDFSVQFDGAAVAVAKVTISGNTVTLGLGQSSLPGMAVTVTYTAGDHPVASSSGSPVPNLVREPADNQSHAPTLLSAKLNGSTIVLTFDQTLDASSTPVANDFTVIVGSMPVQVKSATVSGKTVTLRLMSGVSSSAGVDVHYDPGTKPLRNMDGVPVQQF